MQESTRLAEMLSTRLCHDLTGPIGAIANGVEFLAEEDTGLQDQAIELIAQSAEQAVNRLQFYRMAYGRVNHDGEASLADTKKLIEDFFVGTKLTLDWPDHNTDASGISVSRRLARLLFNLIQIVSSTLIRGGSIEVLVQQQEASKSVTLTGIGQAIKWEAEQLAALQQVFDIETLGPASVQPYYCQLLAKELGVHLAIEKTDGTFAITATQNEPQPIING